MNGATATSPDFYIACTDNPDSNVRIRRDPAPPLLDRSGTITWYPPPCNKRQSTFSPTSFILAGGG
jgi:hypothetical protein